MLKKLRLFQQDQRGFTLTGMIVSLLITGVIALGAGISTFQLLRGPERANVAGANVRTQLGEVREGIGGAPPNRLQGYPKIYYAIIALNSNLTVGGTSQVISDPPSPGEGDTYAGGNIVVSGSGLIDGNATATGTITAGESAITGTRTPGSPAESFDKLLENSVYTSPTALLDWANGGGTVPALKITSNGTVDLGPVHIEGDLTIAGNARINLLGAVYVDGEVKLQGNPTYNIVGQNPIVADGDIALRGNTELAAGDIPFIYSINGDIVVGGTTTSGIVFAPNGDVRLVGGARVYGSIIGGSISSTGSFTVEYPVALRN